MGLDVMVASGPLERVADGWGENDENYASGRVSVSPGDFPDRAGGLEQGIYEGEGWSSFRVGAYSTYNHYRDQLSQLALGVPAKAAWADRAKYRARPFYEQVDFSDCEGTIAGDVARKLDMDYEEWEERAREAWGEDSYLFETYTNFRDAFRQAAETAGAVIYG